MNNPVTEITKSDLENQEPVFLVGAERSGTTVLRLMLNQHPQLVWCGQVEYVVSYLAEDGSWPDLEEYYRRLRNDVVFIPQKLEIDTTLTYPELIKSFIAQHQKRTQKPMVGATVHWDFDRLLEFWPRARFIHIVRDGRDVARSNVSMGWTGNVWTGSRRWIEAETLWDRFSKQLSPDIYLEIAYEDLIRGPKETLTKICEFIGLPYSDEMLSYAKTTVYDLPDPAYLNQWKRKLSNFEIRLIESRIGDMLERRNYPTTDLPPIKMTHFLKLWLLIQDRVGRARFRLKKYGLALFIENFLANRFGNTRWKDQTRQKFIAVDFDLRRKKESRIMREKGAKLKGHA